MIGDKNNAEERPQKKEEVGGMPVEEFARQRRRQPIADVIDEHLDRSAFGLGVVDGPVEIHQVTKDDIAPVMVPVLEGVAAYSRKQ